LDKKLFTPNNSMIDSNTALLSIFALISFIFLVYRNQVKISYEKQIEGGTEKLTMEFIPPHFHPPVQPPEVSQPQAEKVIHEPIEINNSPISLLEFRLMKNRKVAKDRPGDHKGRRLR
jgi:hypothetical protein